jgi:PAS domain S-box-containing protein
MAICLFVAGVSVMAQDMARRDPSFVALEALPPAAADGQFAALPLRSFAELTASRGAGAESLVRVRGVVTAKLVAIFLQDSSTNLYATGMVPQDAIPGDVVELVGYPAVNPLTPELRVTGSWKLGVAPLPRPRVAMIDDLVARTMDAQRVEVSGRVAALVAPAGPETWVLEQNGTLVLVSCLGSDPLPLKVGNEVRAWGVCSLRRAEDGRILGARLFLNSPDDIVVTKAVPFWTRERMVAGGIATAGLVVSGAVWLWLLRRRVATQASILQERFERLSAMERLHGAVFSSLGEGIVVVDSNGRIVEVNPAAEKICGVSAEQMVGASTLQSRTEAVYPDERPCPTEEFPINTTLRTGKPVSGMVMGLKRPSGERFWISVSSQPLFGLDAAKPSGAVSSFQDITEQVATEREARRLEGQLRQAQKMKALGILAGGVAHDFNNLLGVILGNTSMAREELAPGHPSQPFLDESLRACHRAADLIRQILAFSRKRDAQRQTADLRPVVTEAVNLLRSTIPACVEIEWKMPTTVSPVFCAASEIHQVVMNLGTNAWQALEGRPGRIVVELADAPDLSGVEPLAGRIGEGRHVRLTVRDNGRGIDAEVVDRIFEPFYTTKPAGEGTGLGLAVVHGIVESHGGAVALETAPGHGTRFDILLLASDEPIPADIQRASAVNLAGHGEAILVVDDEPGVARTVQLMLHRHGYNADYVTTPGEAQERLRERAGHYRLLLTDLSMPVMTGCQLAVEARTIQPDLVVILMTGFGTDLKPVHLREAGIAEMLLKPFSPETVAETLHRVLVSRGGERLATTPGTM